MAAAKSLFMKTVFTCTVNTLLLTSPPISPMLDSGRIAVLFRPLTGGYISESPLALWSAVNIEAQGANWLNLQAHSITLLPLYMPF